MSSKDPTPQTTLVVLLGASEWPEVQEIDNPNPETFVRSAADLRGYLLDQQCFSLPTENLLDLFDKDLSSDQTVEKIELFLKQRISEMTASGDAPRDLLVYFIGHGVFADNDQYYLTLRSTRGTNIMASAMHIKSLAH